MVFCAHCGAQMEEGTHYCPSCGKATAQARAGRPDDARVAFENLSNKGMACLSYLGILVLIPFIAEKGNRFVRYHACQGLVLFLVEIAYWIAMQIVSASLLAISWRLVSVTMILSLAGFVFLALSICGLVNVFQGRAKELPLIGKINLFR